MKYTWNSVAFDLPNGLVDQTIVTLVDHPDQPTFTVTVATDARGGQAFAAYVDGQLQDLARTLPGYAQSSRADRQVGQRAAVVVEHKAKSPQGAAMRQRQAYVDAAHGVVIVTVTCADRADARADEAFDQILKTMG